MSLFEILVIAILALVVLMLWVLVRRPAPLTGLEDKLNAHAAALARLEGSLLTGANAQEARLSGLTQTTTQTLEAMTTVLREQLESNSLQLKHQLAILQEGVIQQLAAMNQSSQQLAEQLRATLNERLAAIQADNAARLEEMRKTVDEKLHATLEQRLGQSFQLVSERLELVHRGLGEMQTLAAGVGDLKRVLTNVKTRGIWGEVQLIAMIDQILTPEQFATNVATRPHSNDRVEVAIKLPGGKDNRPVWLPIDAKFPVEDYQRLLDAQERADPEGAEAAAKALEQRLRAEAKTIREKYVEPPYTTDFAILYLPAEGLYAEALRRPGLAESLQRELRVVLAGPTNLAALLNSLQMGFRTLAIEKRASEVWEVLGQVKTEFAKFGEVLEKTKTKLDQARSQFDQIGVRSRAIERKLRDVEALPLPDGHDFLPEAPED
jgi:DNA recombination protein RmuC